MAIELDASLPAPRPRAPAGGTDRATDEARPGPVSRFVMGSGAARVNVQERLFFTERLALLLETGSPLHAALGLLSSQSPGPGLARVTRQLADDIAGGMTFARALSAHPDAFPRAFVNLVAAGEQGGFLPTVLNELTAMEEKTAELRATVRGAFSYPLFLIVFSTGVVLFVLTYVFPKFADLFRSIRDQLPLSTLVLMAASDLLRQHWAALIGATAGAGVALRHWLTSAGGRAVVDRYKLGLPVVREVYVQFYLVQSMRVMGLSLEHGVSVPDALRACRDVVNNVRYREFLAAVEHDVNEGRGITPAFVRAPFVPDLARQLIATGEESGNLALVMRRLSGHYERELTRRLHTMARLIEPTLLLVMGAVVGLIVASLILPIFKLSRAVGV